MPEESGWRPSTGRLHGGVAELIDGRLYFAAFSEQPTAEQGVKYVNLDTRVHYESFYSDFGPLNLSVLYRFCKFINALLASPKQKRIVVYTSFSEQNRVNGAYVMGSYVIIHHQQSADSAYLRLRKCEPPPLIGFRDAAMGPSTYSLHLHDVLRGVEKALMHRWLDFETFDAEEYELYERVENGDLNWIIPGKVLSFCGPHQESRVDNGYPYHAPEVYFDYFRTHNVSTIIRLNTRMYDAKKFINAGFDHVDLFFVDGSTPSDEIVMKFIRVLDEARGAVAVHCKAGLGRTGTLIACWMMKEYSWTAAECMAWLRICRPGSVIGPQQQFLIKKQRFCWALKNNNENAAANAVRDSTANSCPEKKTLNCLANKVDEIKITRIIRPSALPLMRRSARRSSDETDETAVNADGQSQGDRLLAIKARVQHSKAARNELSSMPNPTIQRLNSNHAHFTSPTTPIKPLIHTVPRVNAHSPPRAVRTLSFAPESPVSPPSTAASSRNRLVVTGTSLTSPTPTISNSASSPNAHHHHSSSSSSRHHRLLSMPISRVTVSSSSLGRTSGSAATKSSSAFRKQANGMRPRPYPSASAGIRVELEASPEAIHGYSYELRPRKSPGGGISGSSLPKIHSQHNRINMHPQLRTMTSDSRILRSPAPDSALSPIRRLTKQQQRCS